jgi:ElaB/YqjD/DUF883 family membrane-anchored ribosome-binding protein
MNHHAALTEKLIDEEVDAAQREYDSAQKRLDDLLAVVNPVMHARNMARARLAKVLALKHEPYVGDAC